jgi:hypothetical protein
MPPPEHCLSLAEALMRSWLKESLGIDLMTQRNKL